MGSHFKLRVCTWNVGNAAPPGDLSAWLGTDTEDFDIIVVGAQEANFGVDKVHPPSSASPSSASPSSTSPSSASPSSASPSSASPSSASPSSASPSSASPSIASPSIASPSSAIPSIASPSSASPSSASPCSVSSAVCSPASSSKVASNDALVGGSKASPNVESGFSSSPFNGKTFRKLSRKVVGARSLLRSVGSKHGKEKKSGSHKRNDKARNGQGGRVDEAEAELTEAECKSGNVKDARTGWAGAEKERVRFVDDGKEESLSGGIDGAGNEGGGGGNGGAEFSLRRMLTGQMFRNAGSGGNGEAGEEEVSYYRGRKFSKVIEGNMPESYELVVKCHLMEIKLLIYVHKRHKSRVRSSECVTEATGIGNVVGNKGGVAAKLRVDDTTFCFVCSHLAAHEGRKFLAQRNEDVVEIMRNIERNKIHGLPAMHQYNHLFWLGDLNYRLDLKRVLPAATSWSHQECWSHVVELIENCEFSQLAHLDELVHEMAEKRVFAGFVEGEIKFPPTFKVIRGKAYESYQALRVPSYCDRILWHSLPLHRNHIKLREYCCVTEIDTSDHKPVYGSFDLVIPKMVRMYPLPAPRDSLKCTIDFKRLRLYGLYEKRNEVVEEGELKYRVLEDGALEAIDESGVGENGGGEESNGSDNVSPGNGSPGHHTRRGVRVDFHGGGIFVKEKPHRVDVRVKNGGIRGCDYEELPKIALRPVGGIGDLTFKYVTIVFTRLGSKQGSSCVLCLEGLVKEGKGRHGVKRVLELTKYGECVARVEVEVELVVSLETWVDAQNRVVRPKR